MNTTAFQLDGDVALVTGGGTGLGRGIAAALIEAGGRVVITGRRADVLDDARQRLGPEACVAVAGDVTDTADRAAMLAAGPAAWGRPATVLVNNAGIHLKKPAAEVDDPAFQAVLMTHVNAGFALARAAYPAMCDAGGGSVVFMASMASLLGIPGVSAYSAAKSAVLGLTRSLAAEWSAQGVRVNAVAPGWIQSPMLERALDGDPQRRRRILDRTPMGRFGHPQDIGRAVVYLASPAGGFLNGVVLPVDGGASIGF